MTRERCKSDKNVASYKKMQTMWEMQEIVQNSKVG